MISQPRLRAQMVNVGVLFSVVVLAAVGVWLWTSWSAPHRGAITAITAACAAITLVVGATSREWLAIHRRRELFFIVWPLSIIGLIAAVAALDVGLRSPTVIILLLPLVFVTLTGTLATVALTLATTVIALLALGLFDDGPPLHPHDAAYLVALVLGETIAGIMCFLQVQVHAAARDELDRASRTDALTGALNRRGFVGRLQDELRRAEDEGVPAALVVLDLDGFKAINDELGHSAGDALLVWAVGALTDALRPGDVLGRLGGDEFAVALPATGGIEARQIAARLQRVLAPRIAASAGAAVSGLDGADAETLYHCADVRLYAQKRTRAYPATATSLAG